MRKKRGSNVACALGRDEDEAADAHLVDALCESEEGVGQDNGDGNGRQGKPAYSRTNCLPCNRAEDKGGRTRVSGRSGRVERAV